MERRIFLTLGTASLLSTLFSLKNSQCDEQSIKQFGCIYTKQVNHLKKRTLSGQIDLRFKGSGKNKIALLYKYLERAIGHKVHPITQKGSDCIGVSGAMAVDILAATQIYTGNSHEKFKGFACSESIYGGARYEIGYKVHDNEKLLQRDGSPMDYGVEFLRDYGVLLRKRYGKFDLTEYSLERTIDWGNNGIPDILEPIAKQHPVRSFALMESYEDCRDSIVNGYPVIFGSLFGFNVGCQHNPNGRDEMGFLQTCGKWAHAMCGIAVDDTNRPGILLINSAGPDWVQGPKRFGQPDGSFWVDSRTIDDMCTSWESSYALSNFVGFPRNISYINIFN